METRGVALQDISPNEHSAALKSRFENHVDFAVGYEFAGVADGVGQVLVAEPASAASCCRMRWATSGSRSAAPVGTRQFFLPARRSWPPGEISFGKRSEEHTSELQ